MKMLRAALALLLFCVAGSAWSAEIRVGVIRVDHPVVAPISRFDRIAGDDAFAGARLATEDNSTTGRFLGHSYETVERAVPPEDAEAALTALREDGVNLFVVLGTDAEVLALAEAAGEGALLINAAAPGDALRDAECRANLLHVAPSRAMKADAIAQFALKKRWSDWLLVHGSHEADRLLAEAYRKAARKFGATIVEEREYVDAGGSRRADTGYVQVQREIPTFMQGAADHDIVIAADESDVFALYLPFHLWDPRPVMGSAGLRPVNFHFASESWGATQFQRRFEALSGRYMRERDYNTWLALRVIGEAVTRTGSADPSELRAYMLGEEFELAAFKGQKVTFRPWNGQLRQPMLLTDSKITVSVSPQEGFLHQRSPLDTLGLDEPETACAAFK